MKNPNILRITVTAHLLRGLGGLMHKMPLAGAARQGFACGKINLKNKFIASSF
jgi:hypothetical protein